MSLHTKYASLIQEAQNINTSNLLVREQDNVLYIDGEVASGDLKDRLWNVYNSIDPDFRSADVVMNISVSANAPFTQMRVTTQTSNLNVRKGPGTDQPIIGKAAHDSVVTYLSRYNNDWYLIRTSEGIEGYCSTAYLTPM